MKKIFLIIAVFAIMANAGCGIECNNSLHRIANALERIADLMQKEHNMNVNNCVGKREAIQPKHSTTQIAGRSLKAIPTDFMSEIESYTCEEQCKRDHVTTTSINECIEKTCKE